jgi:hypothetical protein
MRIPMISAASVVPKNILTNRLRNLEAGGILRTAPAEDGRLLGASDSIRLMSDE